MLRFFQSPSGVHSQSDLDLKHSLRDFFKHTAVLDSGKKGSRTALSKKVEKILVGIEKSGDEALLGFTKRFDKVKLTAGELRVTQEEIRSSEKIVDEPFKAAIRQSIENIRAFHQLQKPETLDYQGKFGERLSLKVTPIDCAGLYVPGGIGGKTPLVSSALMNVIPAQIAGVKRIIAVSPPMADKTLSPYLLFALHQLGIDEIYKCGGAQAIGALAFGTASIPPAHVITGPGNNFVTEAKRQVYGRVKIDGIFGHSEITVISDGSGDPDFIAADLLSQAEHAGHELALLISTDKPHAQKVCDSIKRQMKELGRAHQILSSLKNRGAVLIVPDLEAAIRVSDLVAPEHLEIHTRDAGKYVSRVKHAGAIFSGEWASEPIGDYICGTNHVLPTNGSARFASPLGVETFLKRTNVIHTTAEAFAAQAPHAMRLAEVEGLGAHRNALAIRLKIDFQKENKIKNLL